MDFALSYEIDRSAEFIFTRNFDRVALQFPDELLRDSTRVVRALRDKLGELSGGGSEGKSSDVERKKVGLYVMADTLYGSCCVDEVGASHIGAECVIHYGHSCMSPSSTLPVLFVFGKTSIDVSSCAESIIHYSSSKDKPTLVLFGLEFTHAMHRIVETLAAQTSKNVLCADVICTSMDPCKDYTILNKHDKDTSKGTCSTEALTTFSIGGLIWELPKHKKMEDYVLFWVGSDNAAFANILLTFNRCEIVRYDVAGNCLFTDFTPQTRVLKRRYYLVEKAKDANIVGILVGTLGVAGYLHMIHQIKQLIMSSGKKVYIFAMGRPNPAKLANFPECDVFVYISCAETALMDSKEFLAPVISPFEAIIAFGRGMQWTGEYTLQFRDLMSTLLPEGEGHIDEGRYSFFQGGYVEDMGQKENIESRDSALELEVVVEKGLKIHETIQTMVKGTAKSGAEFLARRSYKGLDVQDNAVPAPFIMGRSGRAAGYKDEKAGYCSNCSIFKSFKQQWEKETDQLWQGKDAN
ncbi:hypothetical protein V2J09_023063 [Rumex salicifolius]